MGTHIRAFAAHHRCRIWTRGNPQRSCPFGHTKEKEEEQDEEDKEAIGDGTGTLLEVPDEITPGVALEEAGVAADPIKAVAEQVARADVEAPVEVRQTVAVSNTRILQLQEAHNETQGVPPTGQANFGQVGLHNESQGVPSRLNIGPPPSPQLAQYLTTAVVRNMAIRKAVTNARTPNLVRNTEMAVAEATFNRRGVSGATRTAQTFQLEEARSAVRSQAISRLQPRTVGRAWSNTSGRNSAVRQAENIRVVTKGGTVKGVRGARSGRGAGGKKIKQPNPIVPPVRKQAPKGRIVETDSGPVWLEDEYGAGGRRYGSQGQIIYG